MKVTKEEELKKLGLLTKQQVLTELNTSEEGLTTIEAQNRLVKDGPNKINSEKPTPPWLLFIQGLEDPFVIVLAFLMIVSFITGDPSAGTVMAVMIVASAIITFVQQYRSQKASLSLKKMIENTTATTRDGKITEISMSEVVPGDVVNLKTGDMIPADAYLIWTKDLFVNQSSLTGESMPVEKITQTVTNDTNESALDLKNLVFMGTDVISGQGKAVILKTGQNTFFGDIGKTATSQRGKTAFDQGISRVSKLLIRIIMVLFPLVFLLNGLTKGNWSEAFFFAIAVAVGLTPEMLPMIVTTNLAKGAMTLSKNKVIVKELPSIQNLGSMDVLCTDKTGTITENRVVLVSHLNPEGKEDDQVLQMAYLNANYQTGWKELMDQAIVKFYQEKGFTEKNSIKKIDEIPFDFSRRRLSVIVEENDHQIMVTKGADEEMAAICKYALIDGKEVPITPDVRHKMTQVSTSLNQEGMRVLTVAYKKDVHTGPTYSVKDECDMILVGFVGFLDPPKSTAKPAIESLHQHGVVVKVLTGDNAIVAQKVCTEVGIAADEYLLGNQIDQMSDNQLSQKIESINLFAKLNPMQKLRIIQALQNAKHTVGYMGDGINDAPSLRKADVGISVDTAADITKDASSIILLEKSLNILETGVIEGRRDFCNIMKYIKLSVSSNFGNVFSMLIASVFLPFLPMMSIQILVQNLLYDLAQTSVPWDHVDAEDVEKPVQWGINGLLKFTLCIGPVSSIFDVMTFIVMWFVLGANTVSQQHIFQTGWFMVGLTTQTIVVWLIRTKKIPFIQSSPSKPVIFSGLATILIGLLIVLSPLRSVFNFTKLPLAYWGWFAGIIIAYSVTMEIAKKIYIKINKSWI
ncbi:magnesium-translocating P-type ATPase [Xylocopilactobacillus apicola]|uniref:Magnesium-transporting ATPase, P-type 1 n=1 Tax=Xylocopilactobacillus apicola TaxID=2932184 RepID=A0AAU9CXJ2_9LACO|nr:magnesium-translocating P-type ATPase [Xylocopilactobacillus apicola]BDR58709.1 magnesium-translocating P-type ATPase [Xylocopilactobacillus apicola]